MLVCQHCSGLAFVWIFPIQSRGKVCLGFVSLVLSYSTFLHTTRPFFLVPCPKHLTKVAVHETSYNHSPLNPRNHAKETIQQTNQRNRLKLLAYRQGISVGELKHRLKSEDVQESHNPTAPQEAAAQEGAVQEGAAQEAAVPAPPGGTTTVTRSTFTRLTPA